MAQQVKVANRVMDKPARLPALEAAMDRESREWLEINRPDFLVALEKDMSSGVSPDQIFRAVLSYTGREELAHRLRQAARNMQRAE